MTLLVLCQVSPGSCSSSLTCCIWCFFNGLFCCCVWNVCNSLNTDQCINSQHSGRVQTVVMYRHWRHQLVHSCSFPWGRRQRHGNVVDSLNVFADKTITPYEGGFKQVTWRRYVHYICRTAIRTVGLLKKIQTYRSGLLDKSIENDYDDYTWLDHSTGKQVSW